LWAAVSAAYSALLSSSYFERINDDEMTIKVSITFWKQSDQYIL